MRLGPERNPRRLGVGGMGEVYRATDTSRKREAAINALPVSVGGGAERLTESEREAGVRAALNFPYLAVLPHGVRSGRRRPMIRRLASVALTMSLSRVHAATALGQNLPQPAWGAVESETLRHFQALLRHDTTSPPGNETRAVDYSEAG